MSEDRFVLAGRRRSHGFGWVVLVSIIFHGGALAAAVIVQGKQGRDRPINTAIPVKLVRLGKKRDPKLLPRKVAPAPLPPPEAVVLETASSKKPVPVKPKAAKPKTQTRPSARAQEILSGRAAVLDNALRKIEEPEGDPLGDVRGTTTDAAHAATGYAQAVSAALQSAYSVPELIPASERRFLEARVVLYIQPNGAIARVEFVKRHPNKLFMSALEKLLKTLTLPPPPAKLARRFRKTGLEVKFSP